MAKKVHGDEIYVGISDYIKWSILEYKWLQRLDASGRENYN